MTSLRLIFGLTAGLVSGFTCSLGFLTSSSVGECLWCLGPVSGCFGDFFLHPATIATAATMITEIVTAVRILVCLFCSTMFMFILPNCYSTISSIRYFYLSGKTKVHKIIVLWGEEKDVLSDINLRRRYNLWQHERNRG